MSSLPTGVNLPTISPDCAAPYRGRAPLFFRRLSRSQECLSGHDSRSDVTEPTPSSTLTLTATNEPWSPKGLTICGFLPLPSTIALPVCIPMPGASLYSHSELFDIVVGESTPDPHHAPSASSRVLLPPSTPTWIATPPTPPQKPRRRSHTTRPTRRLPFTSFSPSASFPASMHPHAALSTSNSLKRSTSLPAFPLSYQHTAFSSFMDTETVQSPRGTCDFSNDSPVAATFSTRNGDIGPVNTGRKERAKSPIFHLPSTIETTDNEEYSGNLSNIIGRTSHESPSLEGSWSDHSVEDIWEAERNKDAVRRFHALKELLSTEVGYLKDLQFLVTVYLRNLPTLVLRSSQLANSTFGRASASFTSGPWVHSYTQLQAVAATASSTTLLETQNISPSASSTKEPSNPKSRYIFSDHELELLTRNAEEILQVHEQFVKELYTLLVPLGFTMEQDEDDLGYQHPPQLDAAIRIVSAKFATEASRFNAYQTFCAGHPEAMDVLRRAFQHFPLDLDAFELRCSTMISDMLDNSVKPAPSEPSPRISRSSTESPTSPGALAAEDRKRAMSLTSLDGAVKSLRARSSMTMHMAKDSVAFPTESKREKSMRRIAFMDYMIKPIQRICKYPLLLDQLLPSKALRTLPQNRHHVRSGVDVVVESAAQAMRHVAASVDEARHRQDIAIQSGLIFSRMCFGLQSGSSSGSRSAQAIASDFLSSLGNCLLSGSLDAMHYHPNRPLGQTSSIKAKYFGAFLYNGGYLILVKVLKGKKYEPRHWFSLIDFEISDVEDEGAILPCSFRLSYGEQHFELAAACQREKDTWLSAIHEALTHVADWVNEPTPSYKFDGKGELLPAPEDGHSESPNGLPTIRSIPELGNISDTECSEPFFASLRRHKSTKKKKRVYEATTNFRQEHPPPPSRRSSSTSVKNIFSPMSSDTETVLIRRSSPIARHQVDQELRDVISQSCVTARSYAFSHEMELFQAPKATRSAFSRSNSSMGMGRLSKHESVRVPRRRTAESLDGVLSRATSPLNASTPSNRRNVKKLSLTSISLKDFDRSTQSQGSSVASPCPSPPSSQSSSQAIPIYSPETDFFPTPISTPMTASDAGPPAKHRSFVRNVKDLFHFRPVSPVSVIVSQPSQKSIITPVSTPDQTCSTYGMLHRWTTESRRRTVSVPDESDTGKAFDDKSYSVAPIPSMYGPPSVDSIESRLKYNKK